MDIRPTVDVFYFPDAQTDSEPPMMPRDIGGKLLMLTGVHRPEVLAAEMSHLGVANPEIGEYTGLQEGSVDNIQQHELEMTQRAVRAFDEVVQSLRANGPPFNYSDIVLAGMVACEYSHWGVKRKNGKDYFTHPAAVAAIAEACWRTDLDDDENQKRLERILFVALVHDTFEDAIPDDGSSFLSDKIVITPLFVEQLFEFYGRDDGKIAADDLLLLTKFRQKDKKISNSEYLARLSTSPDATFVKLCDTQYNAIIDPKGLTDIEKSEVIKNKLRATTYSWNTQLMLVSLNDQPINEQMSSHRVTGINRQKFNTMTSDLLHYRPADYMPIYSMLNEAIRPIPTGHDLAGRPIF